MQSVLYWRQHSFQQYEPLHNLIKLSLFFLHQIICILLILYSIIQITFASSRDPQACHNKTLLQYYRPQGADSTSCSSCHSNMKNHQISPVKNYINTAEYDAVKRRLGTILEFTCNWARIKGSLCLQNECRN